MQPFTVLRGAAAPLPIDNVDTDVIIRIERLTSLARDQLGPWAFEALRLRPDGTEDASFVLNQPRWRTAPILLAGRNFGCGSSREGAVWALLARGIRCVIAESFGDIFHANCFQNGVLPIRVDATALGRLHTAARAGEVDPACEWEIDLTRQCINVPGGHQLAFDVDPLRRAALLEGLDDIGRTLTLQSAIGDWQALDREARPWIWTANTPATTTTF